VIRERTLGFGPDHLPRVQSEIDSDFNSWRYDAVQQRRDPVDRRTVQNSLWGESVEDHHAHQPTDLSQPSQPCLSGISGQGGYWGKSSLPKSMGRDPKGPFLEVGEHQQCGKATVSIPWDLFLVYLTVDVQERRRSVWNHEFIQQSGTGTATHDL
jgi:hypothetical protein